MWQPPPPPRPPGSQAYPFAYPPPPPPPPPPRKPAHQQAGSICSTQQEPSATCNSSRRVSSHDGSDSSALAPSGPSSNPDPQPYQHESIIQNSGLTGEVADVLHRLEAKLLFEISRVELEAQAAHRAVATDVGKWRKEREAAWKHVGELKEQSRLLRQRNYELEVQNGHLHRHIMLLQEQMAAAVAAVDQRGQFEAAVRMATAGQAAHAAHAQGAAALAAAAAAVGLQGHMGSHGEQQQRAAGAASLLQQLALSGLPNGQDATAGSQASARGDHPTGLPSAFLGAPAHAHGGSAGSAGSSAASMATARGGSGRTFADTFPDSILGGLGGPGMLGTHGAVSGPAGHGVIGDKKVVPRLPHSGADIW